MGVQQEFWHRLTEDWLPAYCHDPARRYDPAGFRTVAKQVTNIDARDFLRAVDHNVVTVDSGGRFRMPRSSVNEVIFWEHPAKITPRPISLWIEPIVTIAAVARLHLDYGWPRECLGMQSINWEFDVTAFAPSDPMNEHIAGEAKATSKELDKFLAYLEQCCAAGEHKCDEEKPARKNAHKKWLGLKRCRAPIFWAIGPGGDSRVFDVSFRDNGTVVLISAEQTMLRFPPPSAE